MSGFTAGMSIGEALRALAVAGAIVALIAMAEAWRLRSAPPVEWTRKLVHCGGGFGALLFPWLFQSAWTVLALGLGFGLLLRVTRSRGWLRSIHDTARSTHGDLYYVAAIFCLFILGRDQPILYDVSVLVLVVSDTLAALVGSTYGRHPFTIGTTCRTVEGSAAFFLATLLCVSLPLLVLTAAGPLAAGLVAVQVALAAAVLEAVSVHGSDNFIAPVGTFFLLNLFLACPPDVLALLSLAEAPFLVLAALLAGQRVRAASGRR